MGRHFIDNETVRVTFEDGEWIDVKQELTQADADYVTSKLTVRKGDGSIGMDASLGNLPLLERSIVAWSFKEDDKPVPVTPENISNLRNKYRQPTLLKVNELFMQAKEFSKN